MKTYNVSGLLDETYFYDFAKTKKAKDHIITENKTFILYSLNVENDIMAKKYGRQRGNYRTFFFNNVIDLSENDFDDLVDSIANETKNMIQNKCPNFSSVLVVGLGNSSITVDSLGAQTIKNVIVKGRDSVSPYVFAVSTDVFSYTGMETSDHIRGLVLASLPDVVVVVDSLAAKSKNRLYSTVQISDAGIIPGSAVGGDNEVISEKSIGVPVISIGVPTVISASSLISDALSFAKIDISPKLQKKINKENNFFVTPSYCDIGIRSSSLLISQAINIACSSNIQQLD